MVGILSRFLLEWPIFRGEQLVSGGYIPTKTPGVIQPPFKIEAAGTLFKAMKVDGSTDFPSKIEGW